MLFRSGKMADAVIEGNQGVSMAEAPAAAPEAEAAEAQPAVAE